MTMFNAKEIREMREALGLSPTEFAFRLGVSAAAVSRWESGDRHPRWKQMEILNELAKKLAKKQAV